MDGVRRNAERGRFVGELHREVHDCDVYGARGVTGDLGRARFFGLRAAELAQRLDDPDALVASLWDFLNATATPPEAHAERISMAETLSHRSLDGVSENR